MKPIVGRVRARLEPVKGIPPPPFVTCIACMFCEQQVTVHRAAVHGVLRVGAEVVGVICDTCLCDEDRANLARLRQRCMKAARQ
jgi:hypothetical protein